MRVKTNFTPFVVATLLLCATGAQAQSHSASATMKADTTLLSQRVEGDMTIHRYRVTTPHSASFTLLYPINQAQFQLTYKGNTAQLSDLKQLYEAISSDSLKRVRQVTLTGYASPDGVERSNAQLAQARAEGFKAFLAKAHPAVASLPISIHAVASPWQACIPAVTASQLADKEAVLKIINGGHSPAQTEQALRKIPTAWRYLTHQILPPMRRVEVGVVYCVTSYFEKRTENPKPAPAPAPKVTPAPEPEPEAVLVEETTGIIIEMPDEAPTHKRHKHRK